MRSCAPLVCVIVGWGGLSAVWAGGTHAEAVKADDAKLFREEILPLLKESCFRCHGEAKQQSGLRVDSRDALLTGGQNGPAIVVGKPDESLLMKVLEYSGDIQMPPDAKLDEDKIKLVKTWIEKNAPWPDAK